MSDMATEVDTWSSAPRADGEYTNSARLGFRLLPRMSVQSVPELPLGPAGVLWQAPLSLHGKGCRASRAPPCAPLLARKGTRTARAPAAVSAHGRSYVHDPRRPKAVLFASVRVRVGTGVVVQLFTFNSCSRC